MKDNPYGPRNFERGKRAAYEFGAEYQANAPTLDALRESKDSAAFYFREDVETFAALRSDEKSACMEAFNKGRATERQFQH